MNSARAIRNRNKLGTGYIHSKVVADYRDELKRLSCWKPQMVGNRMHGFWKQSVWF